MLSNRPILMADRVEISREIQCDIGHRIPFHKGPCSNVHGHRYRILVYATGPVLQSVGESNDAMVVDFGDLKNLMMRELHTPLDHAFMVWEKDEPLRSFLQNNNFRLVVMSNAPTAEHLAKWCYDRMAAATAQHFCGLVQISSVTIWETPNCSATYFPCSAPHRGTTQHEYSTKSLQHTGSP